MVTLKRFFYLKTLLLFIILVGCGGREHRTSTHIVEDPTDSATISSQKMPIINIYIENSGSMNGFINKKSEFQDAIQNMIALLKFHYHEDNIKLNYINSEIMLQSHHDDLIDFVENMLNPARFKTTGRTGSTDLNEIYKMILAASNDSTISIMVSDCIFSISGNGTTETLLNEQKNKVIDSFLTKAKESYPEFIATTFVQLESHFSGSYWDYKHPVGKASQELDCLRPYFMTIIGKDELIHDFNSKYELKGMTGYKNRYSLSTAKTEEPYYDIVPISYKKGNFKVNNKKIVKAKKDRNGLFEFAVAINLDKMPLAVEELEDVSNYEMSNDYVLQEVIPISDAHLTPSEQKIKSNATHILVLSGQNNAIKNTTLSLKRDIPHWVYEYNSEDDTQIDKDSIEQTKTFGLKYLVEGMHDAYKELAQNREHFFDLNIDVTTNKR